MRSDGLEWLVELCLDYTVVRLSCQRHTWDTRWNISQSASPSSRRLASIFVLIMIHYNQFESSSASSWRRHLHHVRKNIGQSLLCLTLPNVDTVSWFLTQTIPRPHFTKKIENKFIPNIITTLRNDDVIVTSSETTLSRTFSDKETTIIHSNSIRKLKRIVVIFAKQHQRSKEELTIQRKSTSTN